jgi:tRNA threonylcarbamoyladenosine biosynthesis protein TsaE
MEWIEFTSTSPSETITIGEHLGVHSKAGDLFLLYGELGSGKTQLVKGIAKGIGIEDWQYVLSPSYTIMNIYEGSVDLCHVDLYRLETGDIEALDIEEYLDRGVVAVEWAERFPLWKNPVKITITATGDEERMIAMEVEDVSRAQVWRHFGREH